MQSHIATVLPFLAARLNLPIDDLYGMHVATVMEMFGQHAINFLEEVARDPDHANNLNCAEAMAWPAICETAVLVGLHGG